MEVPPKSRSPKAEGNPKTENRKRLQTATFSAFGIRASFGLRIWEESAIKHGLGAAPSPLALARDARTLSVIDQMGRRCPLKGERQCVKGVPEFAARPPALPGWCKRRHGR